MTPGRRGRALPRDPGFELCITALGEDTFSERENASALTQLDSRRWTRWCMDIGRQLRALRRARRRTLEELAAETGFTRSYLSQIETGEATPSLGALAAIAAALGTELAAFFPLRAGPAVHVSRAGDPDKLRVEPNSHEEYVVLGGRRPGAAFTAVRRALLPGRVGRPQQPPRRALRPRVDRRGRDQRSAASGGRWPRASGCTTPRSRRTRSRSSPTDLRRCCGWSCRR